MLGGGGGGGRLLKSISVPASAVVLGLVTGSVVGPAVGAGAKVREEEGAGEGLDERGCVGLEGDTGGDGLANGLGIMGPGITGKELPDGAGALFPEAVIC